MLFFDLGFGANNLSTGLGFRYWHFGASIGLTGFTNTVPAFSYPAYNHPKPSGQNALTEKFTSLVVAGDVYYFHDFNKFTVYANVGYFSQSDTVLVKDIDRGEYFYDSRESKSGMTFGGGLEYILSKWIAIGLGYHTKLGVTAQIGYRWN
jgi:opacity protein-like surface antigen